MSLGMPSGAAIGADSGSITSRAMTATNASSAPKPTRPVKIAMIHTSGASGSARSLARRIVGSGRADATANVAPVQHQIDGHRRDRPGSDREQAQVQRRKERNPRQVAGEQHADTGEDRRDDRGHVGVGVDASRTGPFALLRGDLVVDISQDPGKRQHLAAADVQSVDDP